MATHIKSIPYVQIISKTSKTYIMFNYDINFFLLCEKLFNVFKYKMYRSLLVFMYI